MSDDPEEDYSAHGVSTNLITTPLLCSELFVIARNSSFTYKGQAVDIRRVRRELGVGSTLEGSVQRGGGRRRISGQCDRAAQVVQELLEFEPGATISGFFSRIPLPVEAMAGTYAGALKAAELPE